MLLKFLSKAEKGRHFAAKKLNRSRLLALVALIVLCAAVVGTTVAYAVTRLSIRNVFGTPDYDTSIEESFDGETKSDVAVRNNGDTAMYFRATVVCNWVNEDGEILYDRPEAGTDYTIVYDATGAWFQGTDGYWYYSTPIQPGEKSAALIQTCTATANTAPRGYSLSVKILTEAVQADPADAVTEAWPLVTADTSDGSLSERSDESSDSSSDSSLS